MIQYQNYHSHTLQNTQIITTFDFVFAVLFNLKFTLCNANTYSNNARYGTNDFDPECPIFGVFLGSGIRL